MTIEQWDNRYTCFHQALKVYVSHLQYFDARGVNLQRKTSTNLRIIGY